MGSREGWGAGGVAGLLYENTEDPAGALAQAKGLGYNFVCLGSMLKPAYVAKMLASGEGQSGLEEPFSWFDLSLKPGDWSCGVVGVLTNLNSYLESSNQALATTARNLMRQEIEFAKHLFLPSVIVKLPESDNHTNLAQIVHGFTTTVQPPHFWIRVPMTFDTEETGDGDGLRKKEPSSWHIWNRFRTLCNFDLHIYACLELTQDLPDSGIVNRWLGEPVKSIIIPTRCFITNSKGFPVLSRAHQAVLKQFMLLGAQVVIEPTDVNVESSSLPGHRQFLKHVHMSEYTGPSVLFDGYGNHFISGYEDYLQSPLQPLQDNLESAIYDVFEKDPVKYKLYEEAVYQALMDMVKEEELNSRVVVLMVVGAGRGPLVRCSLRAAERSRRQIKVYAIEKNRNAANTIHYLNANEWNGRVTVVNMDMREWTAPEKANILVSELLGSFGDNELSPECLDGAQTFLAPGGVMIPQSYRSYISPIMSSKIYNAVRKLQESTRDGHSHWETSYVIHLKNRYEIAKPEQLFSFEHPKKDMKQSNDRYGSVTFQSQEDCVLHGFAGYFESNLYKDVIMSILPATFSEGMFSWFPIFFPLKDPVDIRQADNIRAHFWRCSSRKGVWYEWTITDPVPAPIHNPKGRSYTIGL